ncbi:MAG: hypothetical protein FWF58_00155, partial [Firmicutes bacterium]|nr:hypothetical protein [Bacillota bacterium]
HSHDKNIPSVEYDNIFICNGKRCGVSAKRTLRERYKQNHDDVQNLEVDYMFVITLGIDLDSNKLDNILSKQGNFVIVSAEQYKLKSYFFTNPKVISSDDIKLGFDRLIV